MSVTLSDETLAKLNRLNPLMLSKRRVKRSCSFFLRMSLLKYVLIKKLTEMPVKESISSPFARVARGNLRNEVLKRDSHTCQYPGGDETMYLQLDHLTPYAKGGLATSANLKV
jgi:hypothetical protein